MKLTSLWFPVAVSAFLLMPAGANADRKITYLYSDTTCAPGEKICDNKCYDPVKFECITQRSTDSSTTTDALEEETKKPTDPDYEVCRKENGTRKPCEAWTPCKGYLTTCIGSTKYCLTESETEKCVQCLINTDCSAGQDCKGNVCTKCPAGQYRSLSMTACQAPDKACFVVNDTQSGIKSVCADDEVCLTKSMKNCELTGGTTPYCFKKKDKSGLKKITGKLNGKELYISNVRVNGPDAYEFCFAYDMHLAQIQEACAKDYTGDSGHACPNIQGQFPEYAHDNYGDLWIDANDGTTANKCNLLRVTNSCGNNHYDNMTAEHYALCAQ